MKFNNPVNKFCVLLTLFNLILLYCITYYYYNKRIIDTVDFNQKIFIKIKEEIMICKSNEDYFISFLAINNKDFSFIDIFTINKEGKFRSVRQYNKLFLKKHRIDNKTYNLINDLRNLEVVYFEDLNILENKSTIKFLVSHSKKTPESAGFTVIKNTFGNVIYIFIITNTKKNNQICQKEEFMQILENIANYTKQIL